MPSTGVGPTVRRAIRVLQRRLMRGALLLPTARPVDETHVGCRAQVDGRPLVPVFVIHWRAPEWCIETVDSMLAQDGVDVDVCVLDNSAHETAPSELLRSRLRPEVLVEAMPGNPGYAAAANRALELWSTSFAECDVGVIMCHDCVLDPRGVQQLVGALRAHGELGIVGPRMSSPSDRLHGDGPDSPSPRSWVTGACMAIRRDVVEDGVRFHTELHTYVEDVAFCLDAERAGWRTAEIPFARATSHGSRIGDRRWRLIARNTVQLASLRRGLRGVVLATTNYALVVVLHGLAAIDPRRARVARRSSGRRMREIARGTAAGIGRVVVGSLHGRVGS